jgi:2,4-dienoyl-CoA reductase-like NADH-dependent reductase (Old Yellow Enzyme family)
VYSKLVLRFAKKLLAAVVDKWDSHVVIIEKISPPDWKSAPAGRILEFSILHLAMSEVAVLETRHPIVINEVSVFFKCRSIFGQLCNMMTLIV